VTTILLGKTHTHSERGQKTELTGRSPAGRQRSGLDCRAIEENKEEK
jgi:hypothetical protein